MTDQANGNEQLESQLGNRERRIQALENALQAKERELRLSAQHLAAKDHEIADLKRVANERERTLITFRTQLIEKERVIAEFQAWHHQHRELLFFGRAVFAIARRVRNVLLWPIRPMLWDLAQHPPRPLTAAVGQPLQMTGAPPKISIVTPSLDHGEFLESTITSVLGQDYPNLEYVVQDGGSTDGSVGIIRRHSARLHHWESTADGGQTRALNLGFRRTSGEIMGYLNSDDMLLPGALAYVGAYFASHPDIDVIYSHRVIVDESGQEVGRWILPPFNAELLSVADYIPQETLFWRRSAWDRAGGRLDEDFHFAMDWDLLLRMRNAGARFARLPLFLAAFRIHPKQKTHARMADTGRPEILRLRDRYRPEGITDLDAARAIAPFIRRQGVYNAAWRIGLRR